MGRNCRFNYLFYFRYHCRLQQQMVSILIALLSVIISVFIIPPMLTWFIPTLPHVHLDVGQVSLNIVLRVLLPLVVSILSKIIHISNV